LNTMKLKKDRVEMWFETTDTVSEKKYNATRTNPANYEKHDVRVCGMIQVWPTNGWSPGFDVACSIEQETYPTRDR